MYLSHHTPVASVGVIFTTAEDLSILKCLLHIFMEYLSPLFAELSSLNIRVNLSYDQTLLNNVYRRIDTVAEMIIAELDCRYGRY